MEYPLPSWEVFYLIIGAAAAALTGLQFVVIVLGAERGMLGGQHAVGAFATPTIVHFSMVLLISGIVSAPWHTVSGPALVIPAVGVGGFAYSILVVMRALRQDEYRPVLEDWLWHGVFPLLSYVALLAAGLTLRRYTDASLFWIGGVTIALLFVGIHNAWDAVLYIAQGSPTSRERDSDSGVAEGT
ncbi:MAG: hypothetical protein AB1762_08690 [Gemmatimonadota bacterium]